MRALSFLKEKRNDSLKVRSRADGRKQRPCKTKAEHASPTAYTHSMLLASIAYGCEERTICAEDSKGVRLKAHLDGFLIAKLEDEQINMRCDVNKECIQHITCEDDRKVLILELNKALCRCTQSALWHKSLSATLLNMSFTLNPHDLCVSNKMIDGK